MPILIGSAACACAVARPAATKAEVPKRNFFIFPLTYKATPEDAVLLQKSCHACRQTIAEATVFSVLHLLNGGFALASTAFDAVLRATRFAFARAKKRQFGMVDRPK